MSSSPFTPILMKALFSSELKACERDDVLRGLGRLAVVGEIERVDDAGVSASDEVLGLRVRDQVVDEVLHLRTELEVVDLDTRRRGHQQDDVGFVVATLAWSARIDPLTDCEVGSNHPLCDRCLGRSSP